MICVRYFCIVKSTNTLQYEKSKQHAIYEEEYRFIIPYFSVALLSLAANQTMHSCWHGGSIVENMLSISHPINQINVYIDIYSLREKRKTTYVLFRALLIQRINYANNGNCAPLQNWFQLRTFIETNKKTNLLIVSNQCPSESLLMDLRWFFFCAFFSFSDFPTVFVCTRGWMHVFRIVASYLMVDWYDRHSEEIEYTEHETVKLMPKLMHNELCSTKLHHFIPCSFIWSFFHSVHMYT